MGWGRLEEAEPLSLAQSSEPAEFFPQFLCMFEENYPETLKRLFIVKGKLGTTCDEAKWEGESIHKGFQLYLMLYFFKNKLF